MSIMWREVEGRKVKVWNFQISSREFSSAAKDLMSCFSFIKRLPEGTFSGVDAADITRLMEHLEDVNAYLREEHIDKDALNFVLGISSPPQKKSLYNCEGVAAETNLKDKINLCLKTMEFIKSSLQLKAFNTRDEIKEYLLSKSKIVICISSSCSQLVTILSQLNQSTAHTIDLLVIDDASSISSSDLLTTICFPGVRNIVLASEITSQPSILFKGLSSMNTQRHQLIKQYEFSEGKNKGLIDDKFQTKFRPFTWVGVPKHMLAPVRDQGNRETCAFHSALAATETHYRLEAAADEPPRKFTIELCEEDMDRLYKILTGKEIGSETSDKEKGCS
uniref:Uncharacterized protein n=1 Tax=Arundo donax TaxID=35708 RepID=A0A0A8Z872_ARUDO